MYRHRHLDILRVCSKSVGMSIRIRSQEWFENLKHQHTNIDISVVGHLVNHSTLNGI
jgi:hypothetical protein